MNYSWQIKKFATRDQPNYQNTVLPNAVVQIKWKRSGVDVEGNTASIIGYTNLSAEQVSVDDFVSFESLTEDTVVNWLESTLSEEQISAYNDKIQDKINRKSTTQRAVPWS